MLRKPFKFNLNLFRTISIYEDIRPKSIYKRFFFLIQFLYKNKKNMCFDFNPSRSPVPVIEMYAKTG